MIISKNRKQNSPEFITTRKFVLTICSEICFTRNLLQKTAPENLHQNFKKFSRHTRQSIHVLKKTSKAKGPYTQ